MEHTIKKRIFFGALVSLLSFQFGLAQIKSETDVNSINTILFKVTSSNNDHVSYLFGTHHAFGKVFFDSLTLANQALASSELLIKENLNIPGQMAEDVINSRAVVTRWNKFLNKDNLSYIKTLFAKSPTDYNKMTPTEMYVFLNRHFKQRVCLGNNPNDTFLSLDDYIATKAVEQNIELFGLETTKEQIDLINKDVEGMPRRNHKRRLANIIKKIKTQNVNDCGELNWYSKMEIDYQLNEPCRNALLLTDRNDRWIKEISNLFQKKNCFMAVGLSHFMYECGLINQLTELGYTITRIEVK
ncbi:TraB/GumN family protein [Pricia sp. S334]|uniref:TraB/GumN family protein n=1 Tax=Pricia mediterranea TaxID=3076079 RepID=A0ABU3LBR7_9FLAO|nr:TraB/GumN family protein [Pricia sp. S334]MDT7830731.1 TraB/GumN family protein [Pricia sp. S334]